MGTPDLPVTCVDWCDAKAYCEWAGLAMCGGLDGGAVPFNVQSKGKWYAACSGGAGKPFPYGSTFAAGACNVRGSRDAGRDAASYHSDPVGSNEGCVGGYPDLLDMSGNVAEWEDSCTKGSGDQAVIHDVCVYRGGYYLSDAGPCEGEGPAPIGERGSRFPMIGIRCCSR